MAKWYNVNKVVKVWSGHADSAQRKGDIYPPAGLEAIDEYKGSVEFVPADLKFDLDGKFVDIPNPSYPGYWVRLADLTTDEYDPAPNPVPVPTPVPSDQVDGVTNDELARVIRFLLWKIFGR